MDSTARRYRGGHGSITTPEPEDEKDTQVPAELSKDIPLDEVDVPRAPRAGTEPFHTATGFTNTGSSGSAGGRATWGNASKEDGPEGPPAPRSQPRAAREKTGPDEA
jgi:hypothetical protein